MINLFQSLLKKTKSQKPKEPDNLCMKPSFNEYNTESLQAFYHGNIPNPNGLFLQDIYTFSNAELEINHSFIQWLFPLQEKSRFNRIAPCLTDEQVFIFQKDSVFKGNLLRSFCIMMEFYGIKVSCDDELLFQVIDLEQARKKWLKPYDHNQMRITRIMECMDLFEYGIYASALRTMIRNIPDIETIVNTETLEYWKIQLEV